MDTKINQKEDWEKRFRHAYEGANSSSKSVDSMCDFIRQELQAQAVRIAEEVKKEKFEKIDFFMKPQPAQTVMAITNSKLELLAQKIEEGEI